MEENKLDLKTKRSYQKDFSQLLDKTMGFWNGDIDKEDFKKVLSRLVSKISPEGTNSEDYCLISYSIRKFFPDILSELNLKITSLEELLEDPLVKRIDPRINVMSEEINNYFTLRNAPFDYFKLTLIEGNDLANKILEFSTKVLSNRFPQTPQELSNADSNFVIEPFIDERDGRPGIWMSFQGKHLDFSEIGSNPSG